MVLPALDVCAHVVVVDMLAPTVSSTCLVVEHVANAPMVLRTLDGALHVLAIKRLVVGEVAQALVVTGFVFVVHDCCDDVWLVADTLIVNY